jgi:uncharacterized protein
MPVHQANEPFHPLTTTRVLPDAHISQPNGRTGADEVSQAAAAGAPTASGPGVLEDGHLLGSRCPDCGAHYFPQRRACARCLGDELQRVALSTRGVVYTSTVVHQSKLEFPVPYVLAYVDLPEGVRVPGQVTGCDP